MKRLLQLVASLGLLAFAAYFLDWGELMGAVRRVRGSSLAWALVAVQASIACTAARWVWLMRGPAPASAGHHLVHFYRSVFLNFFSPGNLAGDAYRVVALRNQAGGVGPMVVAVLKERVLGVLSFCVGLLLCVAGLAVGGARIPETATEYLWTSSLLALAALVGTWLLPRVLDALRRTGFAAEGRMATLIAGLREAVVFGGAKNFAILMGCSLAALACWLAAVGRLADDLGVGLPVLLIATVAIVTELVRLVPTSFQGIGVREGMFALLVGVSGGNPEDGFVLGAIAYLVLSASLVLAGGIALAFDAWVPRKGASVGTDGEPTDGE